MIRTKFPVVYGARNEKLGVIKIEVRPLTPTPETPAELGTKFLVIDWDEANTQDAWFSKEVFYTAAKINELDTYLEANYDFTGMSRVQKEERKLALGLMLDTQTNLLPSGKTIYGLTPSDWEFTE